MNRDDREERLKRKLTSYTTYKVVGIADDHEDPSLPPITTIADLPRGEWFVIGRSGRREEWTEAIKPAIDSFRAQAESVQCAICKKQQAGPSAFPAMRLSEDGNTATMQAVCWSCGSARQSKELRDALAG